MELKKEEAIEFFSNFMFGEHHIYNDIKPFGEGWIMVFYNDLATFDFNNLTRLVLLAHKKCIRVSIMQGGPRSIKICLHKRQRTGNIFQRHPTIHKAIEDFENSNYNGD